MAILHRASTVCVLGGTGFVGRSVCWKLVAAGYSVRVPSRGQSQQRALQILPSVEVRTADVHDQASLNELVSGCDHVINLVGILNERGHDGHGFATAHVELAKKLLEACQREGVKHVVQMSALKANADRGPSHYLRTKGLAEKLITELAGDEIGVTIFRPSVIFGPGDSFVNRFARLLRWSLVLPLPRLDARFAPVYVEDVATAVVASLADSRCIGQTFELCGPDIYSLGELLAFIKRELGLRRFVLGLPEPLGKIQAWIAEYLIPGKPFSLDNLRSLSVASVCSSNGFSHFDIKAKRFAPIARQYLNPANDHLARLRQRARS
jgi:uncharacterized protein YbjT (DUF2867 family)